MITHDLKARALVKTDIIALTSNNVNNSLSKAAFRRGIGNPTPTMDFQVYESDSATSSDLANYYHKTQLHSSNTITTFAAEAIVDLSLQLGPDSNKQTVNSV